jgi:hypothetical protein
MNNPYNTDTPVTNPKDFYGREEEVEEIFQLIKKLQPVSLTGAAKIGCSSLLYYILHPGIIKKYVGQMYLPLYINFETMKVPSQSAFWRMTLEKMGESNIAEKIPILSRFEKEPLTVNDISSVIEDYSCYNMRIIFCFDGFDMVTRNADLNTLSFFTHLRYLVTSCNATFIIASKKPLTEVGHLRAGTSSPLDNIFLCRRIGFFKKVEAYDLIFTPSAEKGVHFDENDKEFIGDVAYYHPFFMQAACSELFTYRQAKGKIVGEPLHSGVYERLRNGLYKKFVYYFDLYWKNLKPEEKIELKNLCKSPQDSDSYNKERETLTNLCLIKKECGKYKPFSSLFSQFCLKAKILEERSFRR